MAYKRVLSRDALSVGFLMSYYGSSFGMDYVLVRSVDNLIKRRFRDCCLEGVLCGDYEPMKLVITVSNSKLVYNY